MKPRLKHCCTGVGQYGANVPASRYRREGYRFLRTTDITPDGALRSSAEGVFIHPTDAVGYRLQEGDLLLSRSGTIGRSYLHRGQTAEPCAFAGYLVRFTPTSHVEPRFLFYVSRSKSFQSQVAADAIQTTISNVNAEKFGNIGIWLPPVATQRAIADFLDRELASLDALCEGKQRFVSLFDEYRTALVHHAMTQGLDPDAPKTPTGVPWLGALPSHWRLHQLRRVVSRFIDYRGRTPEKTPSGIPLITAGAVRDGRIVHDRAPEWVSQHTYEQLIRRGKPEPGDLLFTSEAPLGEVGLVTDPQIACAQRIILFKIDQRRILPAFLRLHFLAKSGKGELNSRASGSTASGIRSDHLKMSLVPTPPLTEQRRIVAHIHRCTSGFETISRSVHQQLAKLREHRQTLITAAVTGQLDIDRHRR